MRNRIFILLSLMILLTSASVEIFAQDGEGEDAKATTTTTAKPQIEKPKPDIANGKYGEFAANTFDLWKPKSKKPTPLVVFIHGGGLASGDKEKFSANQLNQMLKAGFAVMAINYRLTGEAVFPQHYMDCARAIQFARYNAKDFNIDPKLVGATGGSAGGMTSLWLGFHDDLADPKNADPILRQSTRLKVMAVSAAQTTLVPEVVTKYVGVLATQYNSYNNGKMFGLKKDEMSSPKALELYKAISPLTYLTKDDPPVWAIYSVTNKPLTDKSTTSD
ncbi:MAG: alpha/beta hydrolase, partial [Pyrinomonadaceae bacterium]|nr:alpha/beta hydrolase [Pyrinomonadaceae bacterium]